MRVGYLQFDPVFGKKSENLTRMEKIAEGAAREADLLVLPELAATGYLFRSRQEASALSEPFPGGPTEEFLSRLVRSLHATVVIGFSEKKGNRVYNACALMRPDGSFSLYRKAHLFLDEKEWFDPGDTAFDPVAAAGTTVGLMICFDWYYPEVARLLALRGARVLAHPSNLVLPHCPDAMRTRCLENRVFAVTANRVGSEARDGRALSFIGRSQVVAPDGRVLIRADENGVQVGIVEIDPTEADKKDMTGKNDWTLDRRVDLFEGLARPGPTPLLPSPPPAKSSSSDRRARGRRRSA
jgi:predicted amidohydrolase